MEGERTPSTAIVWLLIALFTVFFSAYAIQRHTAFRTHTADLGQMDLAIWNTAHGRFVQEIKGEELSTRLTDHFEPIFALISLAFWLWDDVRAILILQALALALGALPLYWLAREVLPAGRGQYLAPALAAVYLLAPALQAAALTDFHAAPFAAAPFLFAFYYARRGQYGRMWLPALLVMAVKEEMPLLTLMLAGYVALGRRNWKNAALLAAVSLAWFGLATFALIPHYSAAYYGAEQSLYFQRYGELGKGPGDILRNLFTRPALVWSVVSQPERVRYLVGMLAAFGFLPLLAPEMLLLGAPILSANLLSSYSAMYSGEFHYSAPLVPAFAIAALYGASRLAKLSAGRLGRTPAVPLLLLAVALAYSYLSGFCPWSVQFDWPAVTDHQRLLGRFAAQIPPDAPMSTTPPLNPHFSHRQLIYTFPALGAAEYVLLDVSGTTDMHPYDVQERYRQMLRSGFCIRDAADGYILLARQSPCLDDLPDSFYSFARAGERRPQYPLALEFGDGPRFLGYDLVDDPKWRMTRLRLYWQPGGRGGYSPYLFFFDDGGQVLANSADLPMVETIWYPSSRWRGDEVVITTSLPWNLGERFNVGLGVIPEGSGWGERGRRLRITAGQPEGGGDTWALLGAFRREGRLLTECPPSGSPVNE